MKQDEELTKLVMEVSNAGFEMAEAGKVFDKADAARTEANRLYVAKHSECAELRDRAIDRAVELGGTSDEAEWLINAVAERCDVRNVLAAINQFPARED